mmetsp:Transcript_27549/g.64653  ORF Transcript_27549/g.64653 Transcript_27549/m.64653 type:complete len:386 (+) Transcript_27549:2288-3445(+)
MLQPFSSRTIATRRKRKRKRKRKRTGTPSSKKAKRPIAMGKAGRRKKNRQRRKQRTGADPLLRSTDDDDASASANAVVNNNPHSALLKLRHADPKTRHAALVALQASVLDRIGCDDPRRRRISMKVLQAVREQVVSNDLECSAVAAECLASYLSSSSSLSHDDDDTATTSGETPKEIEQRKQTTASWALVFLGRLEACRKALEERKRELELRRTDDEKNTKKTKRLSKNQRKKAAAIRKRWYAVAAPCFRALCRLIETNGPALDRIRGEGAAASFVDVVLGMLSLECRSSSSEEEEDDGDGDDDDGAQRGSRRSVLNLDDWIALECDGDVASRLVILRKRLETAFWNVVSRPSRDPERSLAPVERNAVDTLKTVLISALRSSGVR